MSRVFVLGHGRSVDWMMTWCHVVSCGRVLAVDWIHDWSPISRHKAQTVADVDHEDGATDHVRNKQADQATVWKLERRKIESVMLFYEESP